jgi:Domain of unknown function (DUF4278)
LGDRKKDGSRVTPEGTRLIFLGHIFIYTIYTLRMEAATMRLVYRNAGYDYEPVPVDMVESGVSGQYRGQSFQFQYPRHIPVPQPVLNLKYRGVAYQTAADGSTTTVAPAKPAASSVAPAKVPAEATSRQLHPAFFSRQSMVGEVANTHRQNIQRRLQHRLEVAKAKGDAALINQLEQEMRLIAH